MRNTRAPTGVAEQRVRTLLPAGGWSGPWRNGPGGHVQHLELNLYRTLGMSLTDTASFTATALRMGAGIIIWAAHFAVIYGFTGLACARRFAESGDVWLMLVPWVIGVSTAAGVLAAFALLGPAVRATREQFVQWMSGWIAALAIVAMVLEGITILWVPVCG